MFVVPPDALASISAYVDEALFTSTVFAIVLFIPIKILIPCKNLINIINEEKYQFTPNEFKAACRLQRLNQCDDSIKHLRLAKVIARDEVMNPAAVKTTAIGKITDRYLPS